METNDALVDDLLDLARKPLPIDSVTVPGLKEPVWCQGLSALERSKYERGFMKKHVEKVDPRRVELARGTLLTLCVIKGEKDRTRKYRPEQAEQIVKLPALVIEPVFDLCRKLSGIGEKELDELDALSAETQSSDSASS